MKLPSGIRRKGRRYEAYVRVNGELRTKTFLRDTPLGHIQAWQVGQRLLRKQVIAGSLADDVEQYLKTVQHMPTIAERRFHLQQWVKWLGGERSRATITTTEIDQVLSTLRLEKSATTVRHYRTALLHLFHRLDGKDAPNPVKASWRPPDPPPQPRAIDPAIVRTIIAAIRGPKTRARLWVMATTGLPHKQLMQLSASAVDWDRARVRIPARHKGAGAAGRWLPLSPEAVRAFRALDTEEAWGPFSAGAMRITWQRALTRLKLPKTLRPYDLRHTAGTLLYQVTGDLATVARLLGHADQRTASRYSLEAHADLDALAMAKVGRVLEPALEKKKKTKKKR